MAMTSTVLIRRRHSHPQPSAGILTGSSEIEEMPLHGDHIHGVNTRGARGRAALVGVTV